VPARSCEPTPGLLSLAPITTASWVPPEEIHANPDPQRKMYLTTTHIQLIYQSSTIQSSPIGIASIRCRAQVHFCRAPLELSKGLRKQWECPGKPHDHWLRKAAVCGAHRHCFMDAPIETMEKM
jgi:hypothetical protein